VRKVPSRTMNNYMRATFLIVALAVLAAGCNNNNSNPNDPSQVKIEFTVTDLVVGTGNPAAVGNAVTVNYTGWLYNGGNPESKGTQFDTTLQPGGMPYPVTIGRSQTITGFQQGIVGMRVGGKRRVYIPSELGYGPAGAGGVIPPNAALVFEIELLTLVQ
jgi:FKBP-type peptidyl-prolyl cis-trans isomerase FkpA